MDNDLDLDIDFIYSQCKKYTDLTEEEINHLVNVGKNLAYFAAVNNTEAFLDVKVYNEDKALIVAEYFGKESIYKNSFLGFTVCRKDEPAVFRSFDLGLRTSDIACTSYDTVDGDRIISKQTAIPIEYRNKIIGVITLEKSMDCGVNQFEATGMSLELNKNESENTIAEILGFRNEQCESPMREGILMFDLKGYLVYSNNTAKKIYLQLGFKDIRKLHFDNMNFTSKVFSDIKNKGNYYQEVQIDSVFYSVRVIVASIQNISVVAFIEDITEYKMLEKKIEKYLVSYQEIHHRVKNNLQTIASLLHLQGRSCDVNTKNILDESINRILSIAVTHELLSKNSGDEASIMDVIKKLRDNMIKFGMTEMQKIDIEIVGKDFFIGSEKSTSVALIVNELIQNSLKYAYQDNENGKIIVTIATDEEFKMVEVKDFGVGYDPEKIKKGSLGLEIVNSYVYEKLKGRLVINTGSEGTTTFFVFK